MRLERPLEGDHESFSRSGSDRAEALHRIACATRDDGTLRLHKVGVRSHVGRSVATMSHVVGAQLHAVMFNTGLCVVLRASSEPCG